MPDYIAILRDVYTFSPRVLCKQRTFSTRVFCESSTFSTRVLTQRYKKKVKCATFHNSFTKNSLFLSQNAQTAFQIYYFLGTFGKLTGTFLLNRTCNNLCNNHIYYLFPTRALISLSLFSASSGVRVLMSRLFNSSRICSSTGSSNWKNDNCTPCLV